MVWFESKAQHRLGWGTEERMTQFDFTVKLKQTGRIIPVHITLLYDNALWLTLVIWPANNIALFKTRRVIIWTARLIWMWVSFLIILVGLIDTIDNCNKYVISSTFFTLNIIVVVYVIVEMRIAFLYVVLKQKESDQKIFFCFSFL